MIPIAKPFLTEKEAQAARRAILSGWVAQGPKVLEFEKDFAKYTGAKYACAVSNCTAAMHLALKVIGVAAGDYVITVSHSFIATANSIRYCGAEPVFTDIDPLTYNMSPEYLEKFLEEECIRKGERLIYKKKRSRVAAVLVVHQMGMPCDFERILSLARKFCLPVVEDAACALGSEISRNQGKTWEKIGKPHGDIACFSFHPRKLLTTGEGGMLTTNKKHYDKAFRLLRHQGMSVSDLQRHHSNKVLVEGYPVIGYNYRLTDIQAAIGIEQLKKLPAIVRRRRAVAERYRKEISGISWLEAPFEPAQYRSNWQSYPVRVLGYAPLSRNQLMQRLLDNGVSTRQGIMNAHEEKPYFKRGFSLVNSEVARQSVILLPIFYAMKNSEITKIVNLIKNV